MSVESQRRERLQARLDSLPSRSGVYRMVDKSGLVIYVGKSRNLKTRVKSYFRPTGLATKTMRMVARTSDIQVTVTNSETEALLLEQTFIKTYKPTFNVLLRDDKSYPYILFTDHEFPRILLHRGSKNVRGRLFGPYPSAAAVRKSISLLQQLFRLRPCKDSFFKNRSRPCLEYQIKRCSAPCVGLVDTEEYGQDLRLAHLFLEGKSKSVLSELKEDMDRAAEKLEFEEASRLRDQIHHLRQVQEDQYVDTAHGDVDAFGVALNEHRTCVEGMFIRDGRLLGHRTWYPKNELGLEGPQLLSEFLAQYYLGGSNREVPRTVLTLVDLPDQKVLESALREKAGKSVEVTAQVRASRARWLSLVQENAELSLLSDVRKHENDVERMKALQQMLGLEEPPSRIECMDVSHSSGEETIASCVVFGESGPLKSDYRRYKIDGVVAGDDYAALGQAIERRYKRIQAGEGAVPSVLIIDGGRGQINKVRESLLRLNVENPRIIGISKGPGRKPGLETIWDVDSGELDVDSTSPGMHLIQHIRDEAHRFAIEGHRARRQRSRRKSQLDDVAGIGAKRKRQLLTHFGSITSIQAASTEELCKVPGISRKLADQIYGALHA